MNTIYECLQERGFIEALTSEEIREAVKKPIKAYIGFDPTADSLHLGNLVGIVLLRWFQKYGHTPVVILGGATGRIGDPSGKSSERPLLDESTIESNIRAIRKNFERVLDFSDPTCEPVFLNNNDWMAQFSFVDFLRDVGKHVRVGVMLGKDSVRSRLESEEGMSFTEFCYQLLQAYDFYYLRTEHDVVMQMGGSDQWGNITAGTDLIRKICGKAAFGLTYPLLTRNDGKKFGKSEEGAIWLSPDRCSPYQFYQYLIRVHDADVIKLMQMLTFMPMEEIRGYAVAMQAPDYIPNTAQKRLAEELTRLIHGEEGLSTAVRVTQAAAPGAKATLTAESLEEIAADMPHVALPLSAIHEQKFVDVAVQVGLVASKGEATRLIQNGGAYLNDEKITDIHLRLVKKQLIGDRYLLFGSGKKKKILISVQNHLPENE